MLFALSDFSGTRSRKLFQSPEPPVLTLLYLAPKDCFGEAFILLSLQQTTEKRKVGSKQHVAISKCVFVNMNEQAVWKPKDPVCLSFQLD